MRSIWNRMTHTKVLLPWLHPFGIQGLLFRDAGCIHPTTSCSKSHRQWQSCISQVNTFHAWQQGPDAPRGEGDGIGLEREPHHTALLGVLPQRTKEVLVLPGVGCQEPGAWPRGTFQEQPGTLTGCLPSSSPGPRSGEGRSRFQVGGMSPEPEARRGSEERQGTLVFRRPASAQEPRAPGYPVCSSVSLKLWDVQPRPRLSALRGAGSEDRARRHRGN